MRILPILAVVVVFAALLVFDTAALLRLAAFCVTGHCGVPVPWIATGGAVLVLALVLALRGRAPATVKKTRVAKGGKARPARAKAAARRTAKPAR